MKKSIGIVLVFSILVVLAVVFLLLKRPAEELPPFADTSSSEQSTPIVDVTASFAIYTLGTKRIFTDSMYHNQSEDVFIDSSDPSVVRVKKAGITWGDFFKTMPFSLTSECLVTGTGQTFCTDRKNTLTFTLNGINTPDVLTKVIEPDDTLVVRYGK